MKHAKMFGFAVLAVGVAIGAFQRRSVASPQCVPLVGQLSVQQVTDNCDFWCSEGTVTGGALNGTARLSLSGATFLSAVSLAYNGTRTYTTPRGDVTVRESGMVDLGQSRFAGFGVVTGGTGFFANASGTVFAHGYSNATGTEFRGNLDGEVCGVSSD